MGRSAGIADQTWRLVMKRNIALGAGAAAVAVAGGIVVAGAAVAAGGSHTLRFTGKSVAHKELGKSHAVETDALTTSGKTVGYQNESCDFGGTNDNCAATFALKGGILIGHYTFPITRGVSTTGTGKITGGLGQYAGDTGTIKIVTSRNAAKVTITYHS
jgi:hypothetical protein